MRVMKMLAAAVAACVAVAGAASAQTLIVLNKSDHEAALVNPATLEVTTRLATGKGPHEVAVSADGRMAYVSNYGAYGVFRPGEQRQQPGETTTVLDLKARKVAATWTLGEFKRPHGIVVSRDGRTLWVTVEENKAVLEIDTSSGKIVKSWKTEQETSHMVEPTRDEKKLYVTNIRSGSVTVITRATDTVKTLKTADGTEGIAISPDGKEVWITNRGANTISVIDVASDTVKESFDSGGKMPIRVKFTPDGKEVFVSNAQSNMVSVFDAKTRALVAKIEVGVVPVGIQMTPDGKHAFVANTNANKVSVIDVAARKVASTFETGTEPDGMAWAK
ncbi:MAG: beta-propeller fold lactonase family protein [Acidobacteria bacterium]|nr:beta-propeller fold lactonase family protein [Acidobacteriota bacterium]